ncbi:uncharacterized protein DUF4382 [Algoriphagus boseongensis]|uniref:Uncharacterized protein DUF4382 n=1 Tax=Algoriphagus boseongensis TaxID=1442587 RepID=A0A4R6T583_9BACT|nr:DUF4382 domain-containing protein [Algoriphagus boseongensis]TDQ17149.1 uncharacterized protein DUF4382 [Algoriphagus boseongensis]
MKALVSYFSLLLILVIGTSCQDNDQPNSGEARVNFRLVDAPADYDEVWIEVIAVRVKVDYEDSDMDEENDDTWEEIVLEGSRMVNLLDLTGGNSLLLGTEDFPEGEIDKIRLILGENNYLMKDGQKINLSTPSAQQSGLKIKVEEPIEGGNSYDLIIDFDAAKSIVTAGNSGNVILKPVLRAYVEMSQGIKGQVLPLAAKPVQVTITGNGMEVNTFADDNGNYSVMGLKPGTYSIKFSPNESYSEATLDNIIVEEDKITTPAPVNLIAK